MKTNVSPDEITAQYIRDAEGKPILAVVDIKQFEAMLEELEDKYDVEKAKRILKNVYKKLSN